MRADTGPTAIDDGGDGAGAGVFDTEIGEAMKTLKEVIGHELLSGSYDDTRAFKYLDIEVMSIHSLQDEVGWMRWPGPHKNVTFWVELQNGMAVGFNENPSHGLSFPTVRLKSARPHAPSPPPTA